MSKFIIEATAAAFMLSVQAFRLVASSDLPSQYQEN